MLVKRNNRHCLMNAVCIIFMILSFVLAGCSAPEKMTVEKLKEVAPVSSYEKVSEMKTIQLDKIITGEDIYAVTIEDAVCYFFGEDPGILILPDENRDQILSYFVGKDNIEEINTRFEKFVNDESIGFSDYLYGNYHVQFFRDENQKPYIQVTFP